MIKMDDCSDSEEKVSATKKKREEDNVDFLHQRPCQSTKKRVVYFAKSDSELESDEDGGSLVGLQNNGLDCDSLVTYASRPTMAFIPSPYRPLSPLPSSANKKDGGAF